MGKWLNELRKAEENFQNGPEGYRQNRQNPEKPCRQNLGEGFVSFVSTSGDCSAEISGATHVARPDPHFVEGRVRHESQSAGNAPRTSQAGSRLSARHRHPFGRTMRLRWVTVAPSS